MCILQQVRYSTVEHNFIIECDVWIGKISVFMNHGYYHINTKNDHSTDADLGWYVNNLAYN